MSRRVARTAGVRRRQSVCPGFHIDSVPSSLTRLSSGALAIAAVGGVRHSLAHDLIESQDESVRGGASDEVCRRAAPNIPMAVGLTKSTFSFDERSSLRGTIDDGAITFFALLHGCFGVPMLSSGDFGSTPRAMERLVRRADDHSASATKNCCQRSVPTRPQSYGAAATSSSWPPNRRAPSPAAPHTIRPRRRSA